MGTELLSPRFLRGRQEAALPQGVITVRQACLAYNPVSDKNPGRSRKVLLSGGSGTVSIDVRREITMSILRCTLLSVLLTSLPLSGCGTLMTQAIKESEEGKVNGHVIYNRVTQDCMISVPNVYSGVTMDLKAMLFPFECHGGGEGALAALALYPLILPLSILDVPLSITADTLILPYTGYLQYKHGYLLVHREDGAKWIAAPYALIWVDAPGNRSARALAMEHKDAWKILVSSGVFAVGWDEQYLVAKQHPQNDEKTTHFYVVDPRRESHDDSDANVYGPFSEEEFDKLSARHRFPPFKDVDTPGDLY